MTIVVVTTIVIGTYIHPKQQLNCLMKKKNDSVAHLEKVDFESLHR